MTDSNDTKGKAGFTIRSAMLHHDLHMAFMNASEGRSKILILDEDETVVWSAIVSSNADWFEFITADISILTLAKNDSPAGLDIEQRRDLQGVIIDAMIPGQQLILDAKAKAEFEATRPACQIIQISDFLPARKIAS